MQRSSLFRPRRAEEVPGDRLPFFLMAGLGMRCRVMGRGIFPPNLSATLGDIAGPASQRFCPLLTVALPAIGCCVLSLDSITTGVSICIGPISRNVALQRQVATY